MGFPLFRFTLNNATAGSLVISEPGGWDEAVLKLERNQEFHSLVEFYDQPLTFYGQSSNGNGGLDYIREIERSQGPDAQITILIEISQDDGDTYETVFDGLIDITSCKEIDFYKAEYGIIRNDFWQKFINRKSTPVNLGASVDVDGNAVTVYSPDTISLTSQVLRLLYDGYIENLIFISPAAFTASDYFQIGMEVETLSEINTKFTLPTDINTSIPAGYWTMEEDGEYTFDIRIEMSLQDLRFPIIEPQFMGTYLDWYIQKNSDTPIAFTKANHNIVDTGAFRGDSTSYAYSGTLTLSKGDEIRIYGDFIGSSPDPTTYIGIWDKGSACPSGVSNPTYITVTANTTFIDTTTEAYQIHDAANSIVSKLTGVNTPVASDYLSGDYGCAGNYILTKGLNIRGYSFADKPFTMTFDQWWLGANPILNLGLGYIDNTSIEIEKKEEFYDPIPSLNLDYVNMIERSYDPKLIFKTIEAGYEKWSAESASGIDDPQTKRTFRTRFKTVGEEMRIFSKFYAASLGIEQTRRNRVELGKDWRLDEDIFIIATKKLNSTLPETGSDFSSVSGLLNSDTRYNIRISATRNLNRWLSFINGCLKWYTDNDDLVFSSGEGNFDMTSTLAAGDCEGGTVDENADIDQGAGHDFLFVPILYEFEYPLTWNEYLAIRDRRKKAIGVSRTASDHVPCFIMNLEYQITKGKAKFTVLLGQSEEI